MSATVKCSICFRPLLHNADVIRFLCDCKSKVCESCARNGIANHISQYPKTYNDGLLCPTCSSPTDNIRSRNLCRHAENNIIEAAQSFYLPHLQKRTSMSLKGLDQVNRQLLYMLRLDNVVGYFTTEACDIRDGSCDRVRLEVASLFMDRVERLEKEISSSSPYKAKARAQLDAALEHMHMRGGIHNRNPLLLLTFTSDSDIRTELAEENDFLRDEIAYLKVQIHEKIMRQNALTLTSSTSGRYPCSTSLYTRQFYQLFSSLEEPPISSITLLSSATKGQGAAAKVAGEKRKKT